MEKQKAEKRGGPNGFGAWDQKGNEKNMPVMYH